MSQRTQILALYNNRLVELVCDENGKLLIDGSISIDASDINIGNVDVVSLPATAAGENYIGKVGLSAINVEVEFTRPSDTTAYTVKDVVGNTGTAAVLTFANAGRLVGGTGNLVKGRVFTDSATALLGSVFRLHLYKEAPTAIADNAQFTLLYANRSKRIGYIDFPALATEGTGSDASAALWVDLPLNYTCDTADTNLYGVIEITTVGAAPASAQKISVMLNFERY